MATDNFRAEVEQFEDFNVTAIADLPEIDVQAVTGETRAVVSAGEDGRLRHAIANSDDDDVGATTFGALNWKTGTSDLYMEVRHILSSIADNKYFIGFGDSIATADETSFSATTDTVTIDTMSDGIGFVKDGDSTTNVLFAVAGAADAVTVHKALPARHNPTTAAFQTLGVWLSRNCKSARWTIDGREVHRVDGNDNDSVLVTSGATLVPGVWDYEQGTAYNHDLDYIYACKKRAAA